MAALALASLALAACGDDDDEGFGNGRIVDALGLEEVDSGYAMGGDPFCAVASKLLNDSDEVETAQDADELGLVIASRQGNVGIEAVPPFAPDCKDKAKKQLNRLDPKPKDD
ncbi:MAG: hypothetical protein ACRDK9_01625 [Solirubrobacterales bacterium]